MNYHLSQMQAASEFLAHASLYFCQSRPLIIPQYRPGATHIQPGECKPGTTEIKPDCCGIVIALWCNADTAQSLLDAVQHWQQQRGTDANSNN